MRGMTLAYSAVSLAAGWRCVIYSKDAPRPLVFSVTVHAAEGFVEFDGFLDLRTRWVVPPPWAVLMRGALEVHDGDEEAAFAAALYYANACGHSAPSYVRHYG